MTVYERTVKLVFWVDLPTLSGLRRTVNETNPDFANECRKFTNLMLDSYEKEVYFEIPAHNSTKRSKRQIGVAIALITGWALNSVFYKISRDLFGDEDNVRNYVHGVSYDFLSLCLLLVTTLPLATI